MSESSYHPYPFATGESYQRHEAYGYGSDWEHSVPPYPNDAYYNKTHDTNSSTDFWREDSEESVKQQTGFDESNIDPTFFTDPSMVNPSATFQIDFFKKSTPSDKDEMFRRAERHISIQPNSGRFPKNRESSVNDDDDYYSESSQSPMNSSSNMWRSPLRTSYVNNDGISPNSSTLKQVEKYQYSSYSPSPYKSYTPRALNSSHSRKAPLSLSYLPSPKSLMASFRASTSVDSPKKHACNYCQMRFSRPSTLQTHIYTHTGEKPFKCEEDGCGRCFSVVSNLRRHQKIHLNKKF
ncbi:5967_t:CDS:2 [Acaulospora morrowiae]|uniref:5967_t:CDS:1 n=1 Tax=Acaulospora morrowiae TaxID=94023 RepID=A0A9N8WH74_9GLOM|nr:5967_t:CDS:2 [Acaulospora morrowiae]